MKAFTILILLASYSSFASRGDLARSLSPKFSLTYYADQSNKYFDTLDTYADRSSKPKYSSHVIRWEWYPWLYLTGFRRFSMKLDRLFNFVPYKSYQ